MIKRLLSIAAAGVLVLAGMVVVAPAASAASRVQITGAYYDIPGNDKPVSNTKLNREWIRLYNTSNDTVRMTGWTLRDRGSIHTYRFGTFYLGPKATVYVQTGKGTNTSRHLYWGLGYYVWNNTGDTATLRNSVGTYLDSCKWGNGSGFKRC